MAINKVRNYLKNFGMDARIIELDESSATVKDAAHALNTEEGQIAKTLGFYIEGKPVLIVLRGDAKIDNRKFKDTFGKKGGHMIPLEKVEDVIGHEVGGVCPFGINNGVTVYLDSSLKQYNEVYPAAGSTNSAIKMTIEELEKTSNYTSWIDVVKEN